MVAVVNSVVTAAAVVALTVLILLLNVVQFAEDNLPLFVADAKGKLNVCTVPELEILRSVPLVPVAKVCTEPVSPFSEVMALPDNKLAKVLVVTLPELSVVNTLVFTVFVPTPANRTVPVVCSWVAGADVPIPILPLFLLKILLPEMIHLLLSTATFVPLESITTCDILFTVTQSNKKST